jgi:mannosyl-3-phosphoglycerate phosphatase family protein
LLAPHHLIFTSLEGALLDARTGSFSPAEEGLSELERRKIPWILMTSTTRAELDPQRKKLGHGHPFVTENGGGIFVPDGYFNVRIAGSERRGRYLCVPLGKPYAEVAESLDDLAAECHVGVAGFHHMSAREIAENTGTRIREAELAREREFDEPFYFTNADDAAIAGFLAKSKELGFRVLPGNPFWSFSSGCNAAAAVRQLTKLIQESSSVRLRTIGIGSTPEDVDWLGCVNHPLMLPGAAVPEGVVANRRGQNIPVGDVAGPAGWNSAILNFIA